MNNSSKILNFSFKRVFSYFLFLIVLWGQTSELLHSQIISKTNGLILLRGWLLDTDTKAPIEADIRIENEEGKAFKISSNSLTGKFEQILESGKTYKIRVNGNTILTNEFTISFPQVENYAEQTDTFYVKQLKINRVIDELDIFKANSSELTDNALQILEDLNKKLRFNRDPDFFIIITGCDSKNAFTQIIKSQTKKKSKSQTSQTKFDQVGFEKLLANRREILQNKIANYDQLQNRIEIKTDASVDCNNNPNEALLIVKHITTRMK